MIRSDERSAAAMEERLFHPKVMIEIDVIQIQEGQQRRIAARSSEMRAKVREVEFRYQGLGNQSPNPFVKIAHYDARPGNIDGPQQIAIHQPARLLAAFAHGCSQVDVEYVHNVAAQMNIGPQRDALLARP